MNYDGAGAHGRAALPRRRQPLAHAELQSPDRAAQRRHARRLPALVLHASRPRRPDPLQERAGAATVSVMAARHCP